ncbi:MAG: hypothetical protein QF437_16665 [Planctomycetota bacterium]|nr:hypothetical protein [Planctomycetota bacterium]MDP7132131.1 hypothetical protein [Planctomycetota bacterium]MDP7249916.1 hypothetical protein [Planctomycetota bacterium]
MRSLSWAREAGVEASHQGFVFRETTSEATKDGEQKNTPRVTKMPFEADGTQDLRDMALLLAADGG